MVLIQHKPGFGQFLKRSFLRTAGIIIYRSARGLQEMQERTEYQANHAEHGGTPGKTILPGKSSIHVRLFLPALAPLRLRKTLLESNGIEKLNMLYFLYNEP
jgi:hypothetical protein